jgi:protein SCO1/2
VRQLISILLVLTAGLSGLALATDGFRAFTAESARRLALARSPRPLPSLVLEDSRGNLFTLESLRGRKVVVDFFYTGCDTLCAVLGGSLSELQSALRKNSRSDVLLLSISFDPRDDAARLNLYAARHKAHPSRWVFARPAHPADLPVLLDAFGITVIPSPAGGFEHNAALHSVDDTGCLAHIADYDDPAETAAHLGLQFP